MQHIFFFQKEPTESFEKKMGHIWKARIKAHKCFPSEAKSKSWKRTWYRSLRLATFYLTLSLARLFFLSLLSLRESNEEGISQQWRVRSQAAWILCSGGPKQEDLPAISAPKCVSLLKYCWESTSIGRESFLWLLLSVAFLESTLGDPDHAVVMLCDRRRGWYGIRMKSDRKWPELPTGMYSLTC